MSQTYDSTANFNTITVDNFDVDNIIADTVTTGTIVATGNDNVLGFTTFEGVGINYFQMGATVVQNSGSAPFFDIASIPSGTLAMTPVGFAPNANGAVISGGLLTLEPASGAFPGVLTAGTQTIGGNKTFTGAIAASNFTGSSTGVNTGNVVLTTLGASPNSAGASLSGQALTLQPATASFPGLVSIVSQVFGGIKTFIAGMLTPSLTFSNGSTLNPLTMLSSPGTQTTTIEVPRVPFGSDTFVTSQANNIFVNGADFQSQVTTEEGILNSNGGDSAPSYSFTSNPGTGVWQASDTLGLSTAGTAAITYDSSQKGVATGFFFNVPTYGYQNYSSISPQTLTAGLWVKVSTTLGGSNTGSSSNIDSATTDNQLVLLDTVSTFLQASAEFCFMTDTSANFTLAVFLDSVQEPSLSVTNSFAIPSINVSTTVTAIVPMGTNDYVEVWIMSDTTCTLTTTNLNLRLTNMC
jgi:hypothetical protein